MDAIGEAKRPLPLSNMCALPTRENPTLLLLLVAWKGAMPLQELQDYRRLLPLQVL